MTQKSTFKIVNQILKEKDIDAELVKGEGYFYLTGPGVENWWSTSICVYRINDLTPGGWSDSIDHLASDYRNH